MPLHRSAVSLCSCWFVLSCLGLAQQDDSVRDQQIAQAKQQLRAQAPAKAKATLVAIVAKDAEDREAWLLLARAEKALGEFDSALAACDEAAKSTGSNRPNSPERWKGDALFERCRILARRGKDSREAVIASFAAAREAGFSDRALALEDPDLKVVHADARFAKLLPDVIEGAALFVEPVTILHTWNGEAENDQFGWVARRVGDLDHDGASDFVSTAPTHGVGGRIYVYSSKSGKLLFQKDGETNEFLGNGTASAFDVNADGTDDVIVGAPHGTPDGKPGAAYVYSGKDGTTLLHLVGKSKDDGFGTECAGIGDVDGDGHGDVVVSAPAGGEKGEGVVTAYSGASGAVLFELHGTAAGDQFGSAIAAEEHSKPRQLVVGAAMGGSSKHGRVYVYLLASGKPEESYTFDGDSGCVQLGRAFAALPGDLDGDGVTDILVSDFQHQGKGPQTGRQYAISGADGSLIYALSGEHGGDGFATSPSDAGELDGDGVPDLAVGAWNESSGGRNAGRIYLYSGKDAAPLGTITSKQPGDTLGFDSVGLGDVDGDGVSDLLVTSAWSALQGPRVGRAFLISGKSVIERKKD